MDLQVEVKSREPNAALYLFQQIFLQLLKTFEGIVWT